jgi:hypothetical protein
MMNAYIGIMLITVPLSFNKNKLSYRLSKRDEKNALYAVISGGEVVGHEVHRVRRKSDPHSWSNEVLAETPTREILAGNEEFGRYGWFYQSLGLAEAKFSWCVANPIKSRV